MTTQKLNGLELARRWMDSLGMRHYGEVDAAIAKGEAGGSGYSTAQHSCAAPDLLKNCSPPWQEMGFVAYASQTLEDERRVGRDFDRLFDSTGPTATQPHVDQREIFVWNETLREAKNLVKSAELKSTIGKAESAVKTHTDLRDADVFITTFDVTVRSLGNEAPKNQPSIDITCRTNMALDIHLWI